MLSLTDYSNSHINNYLANLVGHAMNTLYVTLIIVNVRYYIYLFYGETHGSNSKYALNWLRSYVIVSPI